MLYAGHYAKHFICIISFNHNHHCYLDFADDETGSEKLSNFPKVTQLLHGTAEA